MSNLTLRFRCAELPSIFCTVRSPNFETDTAVSLSSVRTVKGCPLVDADRNMRGKRDKLLATSSYRSTVTIGVDRLGTQQRFVINRLVAATNEISLLPPVPHRRVSLVHSQQLCRYHANNVDSIMIV